MSQMFRNFDKVLDRLSGSIDSNSFTSFLFQEQCQRRRSAHRVGRVEEGAARKHRADSEAVP